MNRTELFSMVSDFVDNALHDSKEIQTSWLVHAACKEFMPDVSGERERAVTEIMFYDGFTRLVKKVIGKFETNEQSDAPLLDGFEHLRIAYTVTRNNVNCLVAVDSLTDEEIQNRINDLRKVGDGCHAHANELERYVEERRAAA